MKKLQGTIIVLILLSIMSACSNGNDTDASKDSNSSEEELTIVFNNHAPANHHLAVNIFEPWKELVEEKTEGRIKIELFHGGVLGSADTVFDDVKGGVYDIGIPPSDYNYDTELFLWTLSDLPFVFDDPHQTSKVISSVAENYGLDKLEDHVHYLGTGARDPNILISKQKITSASDIKGLTIIARSRLVSDIVSHWGATPVSVSHEETYEAIHRGTADGVIYTGAGSVGQKFYEVGPYYVENMSATAGVLTVIMNKEMYEKIPEDLKDLFDNELAPALAEGISESYAQEMASYVDELKKEGVEFISLPEDELEELHQAGKDAWNTWIELANDRGYSGEEIIDMLLKELEKENTNVDFMYE